MLGVTPFLWFDDQAEEAAKFYVSIFSAIGKSAKLGSITRYVGEAAKVSQKPEGSAMTVEFELESQKFTALNGGPLFKFSEAISFVVSCKNQAEVDHFWEKLSEGGKKGQCGWLKDKYGLSWQVVPTILGDLISNSKNSKKVVDVMMKMTKLDIKKLQAAGED